MAEAVSVASGAYDDPCLLMNIGDVLVSLPAEVCKATSEIETDAFVLIRKSDFHVAPAYVTFQRVGEILWSK